MNLTPTKARVAVGLGAFALGVLAFVVVPPLVTKPGARTDATDREVIVVLERTGGVMGVDDRVEVRNDGSYTATTRHQAHSAKVEQAQLRELVRAVEAVETLRPASFYPSDVVDDFQYRIVVGERAIEGAGTGLPEELRLLVRQLEGLLVSNT